MTHYNGRDFEPPAPVANVEIRDSNRTARSLTVPMLLDSGADVTLVPRTYVEQLDLEMVANETYELLGFDGNRSFAPAVGLDMVFMTRIFRGRYLLIEQSWGILGRDTLNHVSIILDGPGLNWIETASNR